VDIVYSPDMPYIDVLELSLAQNLGMSVKLAKVVYSEGASFVG
jgi:hypothetical protein